MNATVVDDHAMKLQRVVQELIHTERSYINDLEVLDKYYLQPLHGLITDGSSASSSSIFVIIKTILGVNKALLAQLEKIRFEDGSIISKGPSTGEVFLKTADFLKVYVAYPTAQVALSEAIRRKKQQFHETHKSSNPGQSPLEQFLQHTQLNVPEVKRQSLNSYLIKPVQRVCKYPLLIRVHASDSPKQRNN